MLSVKSGCVMVVVGALLMMAGRVGAQPAFVAQVVSGNPAGDPLVRPVGVTYAPGDYKRLFVWEKAGRIRIIDISQPFPVTQASASAFLNITSIVGTSATTGEERGLLGLAFHPQYQVNGKFYVYYSSPAPAGGGLPTNYTYYNTIAEYSVADPSNPASPVRTTYGSATNDSVLRILHPSSGSSNHNGGWIAFGPDGYLYAAIGDGGNFGDTGNGHTATYGNARDTTVIQGKILRLDVNSVGPAPQGVLWTGTNAGSTLDDSQVNYGIPVGNPATLPSPTGGTSRREIWAYGLRNPWRCSFDRLTGDLWIGDVGQDHWEEINFQPALTVTNLAQVAGRNYGWRCYEGTVSYNSAGACANSYDGALVTPTPIPLLIPPVGVYPHSTGDGDSSPPRMLRLAATNAYFTGFTVIGGYVYRGCKIPALYGQYVFCDYGGGSLYSATLNAATGVLNSPTSWAGVYAGTGVISTMLINPPITPAVPSTVSTNMVSFGEDAYGELYQVSQSNALVMKFVPVFQGAIPLTNADFDRNGTISVADIFSFLGAWFALDPRANFNRSTEASPINVGDIFAYLGAWFAGCAG